MEIPQNIDSQQFAELLHSLRIPFIDFQKLDELLKVFDSRNPPEGFYSRLLECFSYITKEEFEKDLEILKNLVFENIPTNYALILDHTVSSNIWIYNLLKQKGLKAPKYEIYLENRQEWKNLERPIRYINGNELVIIDEWSLTGDQIVDLIKDTQHLYPQTKEVNIFLMYAIPRAVEHILEATKVNNIKINFHIANKNRIYGTSKFLKTEDFDFIENTSTDLNLDIFTGILTTDTLCVGWWGFSEMIPNLFKKDSDNPYGFMDESLVSKPY